MKLSLVGLTGQANMFGQSDINNLYFMRLKGDNNVDKKPGLVINVL